MEKVEVVRGADLKQGAKTSGILRGRAFETTKMVLAQSRIAGGVVSGWHHHGERELYGFLVSGRLQIELGDGDAVEVSPGDFFHVPAGLVHRDANLDGQEEAWVVNITLGGGPTVVNVEDPRRGARKSSRAAR